MPRAGTPPNETSARPSAERSPPASDPRRWLQLAEKYFDAGTGLDGHVDGLGPDSWAGTDRAAFEDHAGKTGTQLITLAAFALELGVSLMAIGAILAALVTAMAAFATALFALAVAYWAAQAVRVYGQVASQAIRAAAMSVGGGGFSVVGRPGLAGERREPVYNLGMNHDENQEGGVDRLRDDVGADPAAPGWR